MTEDEYNRFDPFDPRTWTPRKPPKSPPSHATPTDAGALTRRSICSRWRLRKRNTPAQHSRTLVTSMMILTLTSRLGTTGKSLGETASSAHAR
jgi:hypothetical protein